MVVFWMLAAQRSPRGLATTSPEDHPAPGAFPKFIFDFVGPEELDMDARNPGELLFRVLTADVQRVRDGKTISEEATFEMIQTIQEAVDKIVAAAKAKAIN